MFWPSFARLFSGRALRRRRTSLTIQEGPTYSSLQVLEQNVHWLDKFENGDLTRFMGGFRLFRFLSFSSTSISVFHISSLCLFLTEVCDRISILILFFIGDVRGHGLTWRWWTKRYCFLGGCGEFSDVVLVLSSSFHCIVCLRLTTRSTVLRIS